MYTIRCCVFSPNHILCRGKCVLISLSIPNPSRLTVTYEALCMFQFLEWLAEYVCNEYDPLHPVCGDIIFAFCGSDIRQLNQVNLSSAFCFAVFGLLRRCILQCSRSITSCCMRRYIVYTGRIWCETTQWGTYIYVLNFFQVCFSSPNPKNPERQIHLWKRCSTIIRLRVSCFISLLPLISCHWRLFQDTLLAELNINFLILMYTTSLL